MKKVPVNSDCPSTSNKVHQWTSAEGKDNNGRRIVVTWCKACGSVPK